MNKKKIISFAFCLVMPIYSFASSSSEDSWRKRVFSHIYKTKHWWDGQSYSGPGSSLRSTSTLRELLPSILKALNVKTLLDAGCGDFNWMKELELPVDYYVGVDIVSDLIQKNRELFSSERYLFFCVDIVRDLLPQVDVILCRDCLAHLSYEDITKTIQNFKKTGSRYLLATDYSRTKENVDIRTGSFYAINLRIAPYNFPEPLMMFIECSAEANMYNLGKRLCLWSLDDISID